MRAVDDSKIRFEFCQYSVGFELYYGNKFIGLIRDTDFLLARSLIRKYLEKNP